MQKYKYRASDDEGRQVRGKLSAINEIDLYQQLKTLGIELVDAKAERQTKTHIPFMNRIKAREMIQAFVHIEQLQRSGVPLLDSLADIRDSTDSPVLRDVMSEIHRDVSEGSSLSQAMTKHPRYFDTIAVSMTASAEETGNLADAFAQLIVFMKWSDTMRRRIIKAVTYPMFTLAVFLAVLFVLMYYTVPQIVGFLKNMNQELPFMTTSLIATSDFLQASSLVVPNGLWILLLPVTIVVFVTTMNKLSPRFKYNWDAFVVRLPVIGSVARKINLSRFSRTFGALFRSGLEILKCMDTATETVGNTYMKAAMIRARKQVSEGAAISAAMNNTGEFPSLVIRMVKIGEESGGLTHVLDQVAEFYDADVDESVQRMIGMITPSMTMVLGAIILW
ncbi:MAG: Type fimbrial assembly protein PilC, partial [Alphaproteobacteria bacterium]|nr:Type fimbrial assembly protein PilC [Alphaproteobacteria bacterium]